MLTDAQIRKQYAHEKWYRAIKEVIACLSFTDSRRKDRRTIVHTTYRTLTDMDREEIFQFIRQRVGGDRETALAVFRHCMQTAGSPTKQSTVVTNLIGAAAFFLMTVYTDGDKYIVGLFAAGFLAVGLFSLYRMNTEFPHKDIIHSRPDEPGSMLRVLDEITRTM